ncbi:hypothetical protein OGAPHI_004081 [Ogataea philodendri]|uniref:Uncharacterized protein n=1 Tax=Ogataea philodendri TaxID=1378263 RepID=A0A9P8P6W3_9ASCO|nr:uncharacterized protein OGAPHI_004081 [Ogataea philodendri]KAH3665892.1 hypothetical protein OGAPHI_004081 [Ogataea philodendri]
MAVLSEFTTALNHGDALIAITASSIIVSMTLFRAVVSLRACTSKLRSCPNGFKQASTTNLSTCNLNKSLNGQY